MRIVFHANNTFEQVDALIGLVMDWTEQMLKQEEKGIGALDAAPAGKSHDWLNQLVALGSSAIGSSGDHANELGVYGKEVEEGIMV